MKTRLLIIIGIIAAIAIFITFISLAYNQEIKLAAGMMTSDEKPQPQRILSDPICFVTDRTTGETGSVITPDRCTTLKQFEEMGCTKPMLEHLYEYSNLLDEEFDGKYVIEDIGLPDGVTQEKFEECVDFIYEKRLSPDIWDFEPLNKMTLFEDPFFTDPDKFMEISEKKDSECFTTPSMNYFCYAKPRMYDTGIGVSWLVSNTTKISGELHFDDVNVGPSYFTMKNMTLIKGDTAKITFTDKDYRVGNATSTLYEITDDFEFTEIIEKFDTFVAKCDNYEGTRVTVVQYLGITTIDDVDYFMTWHTNALSEDGIACDYPQIIQNSFANDFGNIGHDWGEKENEDY